MARDYGAYRGRGATIAGVVIDAPERNAAMAAKLALPFPILSDPDGESAIKPFGVWDQGGKMAKPAIVVIAPDGTEAYRYAGVDFMDRPDDDDVLGALNGLGLKAGATTTETVKRLPPRPGPRAMSLLDLAVYIRGVRNAMAALAKRVQDPFAKAEAERYIAAQGATLRVTADQ